MSDIQSRYKQLKDSVEAVYKDPTTVARSATLTSVQDKRHFIQSLQSRTATLFSSYYEVRWSLYLLVQRSSLHGFVLLAVERRATQRRSARAKTCIHWFVTHCAAGKLLLISVFSTEPATGYARLSLLDQGAFDSFCNRLKRFGYIDPDLYLRLAGGMYRFLAKVSVWITFVKQELTVAFAGLPVSSSSFSRSQS